MNNNELFKMHLNTIFIENRQRLCDWLGFAAELKCTHCISQPARVYAVRHPQQTN